MTAKEELTSVINAIKVICRILLCTLINKQKHSATESKTPKQIIQSNKRGRPPKNEKVNPSTEKYFETDDKKPGDNPAEYLENYKEALEEFKVNKVILDNKLFGMQLEASENPLLKVLEKFSKMTLKNIESKDAQLKEKIENCDDAFAIYLKYCSEKVNADFYRSICKFIILYREAFNQYGPDKYSSEDPNNKWEKEFYSTLHKRYYSKSFAELVSTEYLPDISNELYVFFQFHFNKDLMKELILNFAAWLHKHSLTTARVVL